MGPHPIMPIDNILINIHKEWHGNIVDSYKLYPFPGPNLYAPDPLRTALCQGSVSLCCLIKLNASMLYNLGETNRGSPKKRETAQIKKKKDNFQAYNFGLILYIDTVI